MSKTGTISVLVTAVVAILAFYAGKEYSDLRKAGEIGGAPAVGALRGSLERGTANSSKIDARTEKASDSRDPIARRAAVRLELRGMNVPELDAHVKDLLARPDSAEKRRLLYEAIEALAERAPEDAMRVAAQLGVGGIDAALRGWAINDAEGAWSWINENRGKPSAQGTSLFYQNFVSNLAQHGRAAVAADLLRKMPPGEPRGELSGQLAALWGDEAPDAVISWVRTEDDPLAQSNILLSLGAAVGKADFDAALAWLNSQESAFKTKMFLPATREWLRNGQADRILKYVTELPDTPEYDGVLDQVGRHFIHTQTREALTITMGQVNPIARDRSLSAGVSSLVQVRRWSDALNWTANLADAAAAERTAKQIVARWSEADPAAAKAYTESADLPLSLRRFFSQ